MMELESFANKCIDALKNASSFHQKFSTLSLPGVGNMLKKITKLFSVLWKNFCALMTGQTSFNDKRSL